MRYRIVQLSDICQGGGFVHRQIVWICPPSIVWICLRQTLKRTAKSTPTIVWICPPITADDCVDFSTDDCVDFSTVDCVDLSATDIDNDCQVHTVECVDLSTDGALPMGAP